MNLLLLSLLLAACITLTQQAHAPRDSHSDEDLVPGDAGMDYSSRLLQPGNDTRSMRVLTVMCGLMLLLGMPLQAGWAVTISRRSQCC